ncbi:hypothetical protein ANN_04243 [Periplaneta americana]|uniref:SWIRM domain-containing protein n=1 Tax=Periplaneta americana TaxID=6978 RepID=A0ABQ8T9K8_PERAM|nr:hypothetical protein ANN_04243 [Periplaneta americana]
MNTNLLKREKTEAISYPIIDLERKRPCLAIESSGVSDTVDTQEEGRRMSRRKKAKVEYREMEEKYSQLLDEEDASDASEKSKAGGTATPEKKLAPIPEPLKKETSLPPEQPPTATIVPPPNPVKTEKEDEIEPDSEQDDPTGLYSPVVFPSKVIHFLQVGEKKVHITQRLLHNVQDFGMPGIEHVRANPEMHVECLEGAAFQSRLPFDKMTATEAAGFPDVAQGPPQTLKVFLHIRNRLLQLWLENPKQQQLPPYLDH